MPELYEAEKWEIKLKHNHYFGNKRCSCGSRLIYAQNGGNVELGGTKICWCPEYEREIRQA